MTNTIILDEEEQAILSAIENSTLSGSGISDAEKKNLAKMASYTLSKRKPINIRVMESDLHRIRRKALEEGIPYQTLITSVIHKYANNTLLQKR
jgi:predicted DNA binding CopG/RHH family protein